MYATDNLLSMHIELSTYVSMKCLSFSHIVIVWLTRNNQLLLTGMGDPWVPVNLAGMGLGQILNLSWVFNRRVLCS